MFFVVFAFFCAPFFVESRTLFCKNVHAQPFKLTSKLFIKAIGKWALTTKKIEGFM